MDRIRILVSAFCVLAALLVWPAAPQAAQTVPPGGQSCITTKFFSTTKGDTTTSWYELTNNCRRAVDAFLCVSVVFGSQMGVCDDGSFWSYRMTFKRQRVSVALLGGSPVIRVKECPPGYLIPTADFFGLQCAPGPQLRNVSGSGEGAPVVGPAAKGSSDTRAYIVRYNSILALDPAQGWSAREVGRVGASEKIVGEPVFDGAGNVFVVACSRAGSNGCADLSSSRGYAGVVYRFAPPVDIGGSWTRSVVYRFPKAVAMPVGPVAIAPRTGKLYGLQREISFLLTPTIYELTPPATGTGTYAYKTVVPNIGFGTTERIEIAAGYLYLARGAEVLQLIPPGTAAGVWKTRSLAMLSGEIDGEGLTLGGTSMLYGGADDGKGGFAFLLTTPTVSASAPWKRIVMKRFSLLPKTGIRNPRGGMVYNAYDGSIIGTAEIGLPDSIKYPFEYPSDVVYKLTPKNAEATAWTYEILGKAKLVTCRLCYLTHTMSSLTEASYGVYLGFYISGGYSYLFEVRDPGKATP